VRKVTQRIAEELGAGTSCCEPGRKDPPRWVAPGGAPFTLMRKQAFMAGRTLNRHALRRQGDQAAQAEAAVPEAPDAAAPSPKTDKEGCRWFRRMEKGGFKRL
jgi:hypothetical protein